MLMAFGDTSRWPLEIYAFGYLRLNDDITSFHRVRYSDWESSVLDLDATTHILVCGLKYYNLNIAPICIGSNSSYIFLLNPDGKISTFSKTTGEFGEIDLPECRSFSANDDYLYCITEESLMFSVALSDFKNGEKPCIKYPLSVKVKSVACGAGFALFLTPSGAVFSCGIGSRGQLGHGDLETRDLPELIATLQPVTVIAISAGTWHSACLTDTGDVYTWGSNEYGQLGIPSLNLERWRRENDPIFSSDRHVNVSALPEPVDFPSDVCIEEIACGSRHTACFVRGATGCDLYTFGWNGMGQLGFMPPRRRLEEDFGPACCLFASDYPEKVSLPDLPSNTLKLACGHWLTFFKAISS